MALRHPDKRFMVIDPRPPKGRLPPNVEYVSKLLQDHFPDLKPHSVKILNFDFSILSKSQWTWSAERFFHYPHTGPNYLEAFKWLLVPNGRLYVTATESHVEELLRDLQNGGFRTRAVTLQSLKRSKRVSSASDQIRHGHYKEPIYRIEAIPPTRKKDLKSA